MAPCSLLDYTSDTSRKCILFKVTQISVYSLLFFYCLGDLSFLLWGETLMPCLELDNYSDHNSWRVVAKSVGSGVRQPLQ